MPAKKAAKKAAKKSAKKSAKKTGKKGAPEKAPEAYLIARCGKIVTLADYTREPSLSFLTQLVEGQNTFDYCKRKFMDSTGKLSVEAKDNLQQVAGPLLASSMGHFETFQKSLFARSIEISRFFKNWDPQSVEGRFGGSVGVTTKHLLAYRGESAQAGLLIADSLKGWHSPEAVNVFFECFGAGFELFSKDHIKKLRVLWQFRHTLVHTGGWLTLPDAQKIAELKGLGNTSVAFDEKFILGFTRLMHRVVKTSVGRLESTVRPRLRLDLLPNETQEIDDLLRVSSPVMTYF